MEITIGQVSGVIAAAVFIVQIILPNALILILIGVLRNQHTAVTWSVTSRQLFSSLWPTILRSDAAAGSGVNTSVRLISLLRPIALGIVAIAAVVTPLGLYDAIVPSASQQDIPFLYLSDSGPMGSGTPPQNSSIKFTRECTAGSFALQACPGSPNVVDITYDEENFPTEYDVHGIYDMNIPQSTIDMYQSGLKNFPETVSSLFDIRGRQYTLSSKLNLNGGEPYPVDMYRYLQTMVLNNKVEAVQGLIVDTVSGGIGFRNHTVPTGISEGAQWTEDLLWIEPLTECVNTNLTIEFDLPPGTGLATSEMSNVSLVDNGGFANINQSYPYINMDDNQSNPKLRERAYKAAWFTNVYAMLVMNVTRPNPHSWAYLNSEVGKRFPLVNTSSQAASIGGIMTDTTYISLIDPDANTIRDVNNTFTNQTDHLGLYANPFNVTSSNYSDISILCQGTGGTDYANSSNIFVACGLFYGAAYRKDGVETLIFEPNTTWIRPVYSCASTNKASIKTVTFHYNITLGTDMKSLNILNVEDKTYEKDEDMPLWGIEQPDPIMTLLDVPQLWGLISDENAKAANLSTKRAPELYLPGFTLDAQTNPGVPGFQYIPGVRSPLTALTTTYSIGSTSFGTIMDYSGATNLNMFSRWQELSKNVTTIPQILHLVWTDIIANAVQGTRGWGTSDNTEGHLRKRDGDSSNGQAIVPVLLYSKRIRYHLLYAIPAVIALAVFSFILLGACCFMVFGNGPKRLRHYMQHLSPGRILAAEQYPGQSSKTAPTKMWMAQVGKHMVNIGQAEGPTAYHGAYGHGQSPFMYGEKGNQAATTAVESYPMGVMARTPQGYIPVAGQDQENSTPK